ncbi:hypothetical protein JQX13_01800 [Archangium violaceum]|uniref:hypothetical protein n=1 Tax=Archangium violaceum TaxID=83451 RepID=UPI00193B25C2|nr:hypothetical protein [Archangium violaceum]QRK08932.1 hypothetical protein JQX13_01800 [Archangium violaceum]
MQPTSVPSSDIRRQLEGRFDALEAARKPYAELEGLLRSWKWERLLHANLELLREVTRQEPVLEELLVRFHKRAEAEGWPEETPELRLSRELEARRQRLGGLIHERLRWSEREGTLAEALGQLAQHVLQGIPSPLHARERLLFRGAFRPSLKSPFWFSLAIPLSLHSYPSAGALWLLMALLWFGLQYRRSGNCWLTQERLVWKPRRGQPVQVLLRSIPPQGLRRILDSVRVEVEDGFPVQLESLTDAERLITLMELYRQPPLLGAAVSERPLEAVCIPGLRRQVPGGAWVEPHVEPGCLVIRPDRVAFLPTQDGARVLAALGGTWSAPTRAGLTVSRLLEQLRWLPDTEFDRLLAHAAVESGGLLREARELRVSQSEENEPLYLLSRDGVELCGRPGPKERAELSLLWSRLRDAGLR